MAVASRPRAMFLSIYHIPTRETQIPPDLVVKFQAIDIAEVM
jgi:hypothetical protein